MSTRICRNNQLVAIVQIVRHRNKHLVITETLGSHGSKLMAQAYASQQDAVQQYNKLCMLLGA